MTFNKAELLRLERDLKSFPKALPKVMQRGINDTLKTGRTKITREIGGHVTVKAREIRNRIKITKATRVVFAGMIRIASTKIPLIKFGARETRKGVTVKVRKNGKRERITGAFVATMNNGHKGIFKRTSEGGKRVPRLSIYELKGPTVTGVFEGAAGIATKVLSSLNATLTKNIARNVDLIVNRIRK